MDSVSDWFASEAWQIYQSYVTELRPSIIRILAIFGISGFLGTIFFDRIVRVILHVFTLKDINIVLTSPYQFFGLALNIGLCVGFMCSSPYAIAELLRFAKPAMTTKEYVVLRRLLPFAAVLFVSGFFFGVYLIQFVITLFQGVSSSMHVSNIWDVEHLLGQVLLAGMLMGIIFEIPMVLTFLIRANMVTVATIRAKRKYAYAGVLILIAILPFTNDVLSCIVVMVPLLLLYELTLIINKAYA